MAIMLQRKPTPLQAWHLTDQAVMLEALDALSGRGWRGALTYDPNGASWRMELNNSHTVAAGIDDWLVVDGDVKVMSDADCAANYDVVVD